MSDFGDKGENKPLEIMEESEVNVLRNQQYEEGIKEQIEDNADGLNQSSHLSDTTTSMSTSESCYVGTSEENTVFAHINKDGKKKSTQLLCEPCSTDSVQVEATFFCKTCDDPDPLCETCAKHHLKQKISKDHQMCGKIEEFRNVEQKTCVSKKLLCEPCSTDNVEVEATHFCKTCDDPDPLCATCAKHHLKQKLSKNHEMSGDIEEFRNMEQKACDNVSERLLCEPCSTDNVEVEATHFCKTCDDPDPLCETCAKHHLKQKLSKDHEMCQKIEEFRKLEQKTCGNVPERLLCEPCSTDNVQVEATHFCKTCDDPDPLCKTCAKYHLKQKLSRNHEMCGEIEEYRKMEHKTCDNMSEKLFCEPCSTDNVEVEATHFCKTCDDPDPLCGTCAKHHLKQKLSKNHEMCADIKEYPYKDQKECENVSTKLLCEPCSTDDLHVEATHFCKTCDDPDPLCETCAKHHLRQKLSKNHEICLDMKELQKEQKEWKNTQNERKILCIPCLNDKVDVRATHVCKTCKDPEPLCESCAKQHTRQKLTRNHDVCADLTDFSTLQPKDSKNENQMELVCNPCFNENIKVPATHFCKTCQDPEPFCDMCAKQHTRQKIFREHELCKDMRDFTEQNIGSSIINNLEKSKKGNRLSPPGKPKVLNCTTESIEFQWSTCKGQVEFYDIRYKANNKSEKEEWNFAKTDADESQITITGLMPDTIYIFQVRGVFEGQEGEYGPENDEMKTESLDAYLSKISTQITKSFPSKYQLFVQEMKDARNVTAKTRKLNLGKQEKTVDEKTIMLVGATGSGKSTLVDGIVNYVLGVRFNDPFRFTLVQLEDEEKKDDNQALSQTEWVTVYRIEPRKGSRLKYALNIIDTPGFGDTRGIERDQCTVDQIRNLFTETGAKGVLFIDAVCFIVKAPDARLSVSQRYIFSSLLALFGKDIESNICTLITFADGAEPPVLASLKEANLPIGSVFEFNNSALFASSTSLSPMFWEMGCRSFEKFFNQLGNLTTQSLSQTKDVLKERDQLRTFIASINDQVQAGLSKQGELQKEIDIMNRHKSDIQNNKDFEYEVEETKQVKTELKQGIHVTNCLTCNITCHNKCIYADDDAKIHCSAMSNGFCTVCSKHCSWTVHKNARYILTYETEKVKKTYKEMKEKYEQAKGEKMNHDVLIAELNIDVNNLFNYVKHMMEEMQRSKSRLNEIALRPDPLSTVEHLDLMIQAEEMESKSGFKERIKVLQKYREMALVDKKFEDFSETYKSTKEKIESEETSTEASDKKEKKSLARQAREGFSNFMQHFKS